MEVEDRPVHVRRRPIYAEPGRGRRANLLTDYTFAVRDGEAFVAVAKAYSGLSDREITRVDRWIRQNTLERFGPVCSNATAGVRDRLRGHRCIESSQIGDRVVRFPRIARWREDKPAAEASTLRTCLLRATAGAGK